MKIETHIKNSKKVCGIKGRDIHEWIDGHFEHDKFKEFIRTGVLPHDWNPYDHRVHRHCIEALGVCIIEFESSYSKEEIEAVFKSHLRDDYLGTIPCRNDFSNHKFKEKYHKF